MYIDSGKDLKVDKTLEVSGEANIRYKLTRLK